MDDVVDLSSAGLEAELVSFAAWETVAMARMLVVLAEFDRRRVWASHLCVSARQWLSWKCGLSASAASERLRVAHALPGLPVLSAAFGEGRVSWSKVRAITRVACAATDETWTSFAEHATAAQIDRLVSAHRKVSVQDVIDQDEQQSFSWVTNANGSVTISITVPADAAMPAIAAVRAATVPEAGVPFARAAATTAIERLVGNSAGVRTEVIVHLGDDHAYFDHGPPVAVEIAEELSCDHTVTTVADTPEGPVVTDRRRAPTARQRRRLALRHPSCQFPGCHHAGRFDAHHVVERAKGGRTTLANLVRLCAFHHRLVHLHRLVLTLYPDRTLAVAYPDGRPVDPNIPITSLHLAPPEDPQQITGHWDGSPLPINDCLIALGIH